MVPPGVLWVVRDVDAYCNPGATGIAELLISEWSTGAAWIFWEWAQTVREARQWQGRRVIPYSQGTGGFYVANNFGEPVDVHVSGYELADPSAAAP